MVRHGRDYLEGLFERKAVYFRETENAAVIEKVDEEGNIIGFSLLKVSALKENAQKIMPMPKSPINRREI